MQIDRVTVAVGQNLNFNMARLGDEFFNENPVIAKAGSRFILGRLKALARLIIIPRNAHTFAAATGAGFNHYRIANLTRDFHRLVGIRDQAHIAWNGADPRFLRQFLRGDLVAHRLDRASGRPDEGNAFFRQGFGKFHVLGQEPITRMHRFRPGLANCIHNLVNHDIGLVRGRGADMDRLIRHLHMQRVAVGIRIDRNGCNSHLSGGLDDTAGNFAPVGDQDLF